MCAASCTCAADGPSSKKVRFSFRGGFDECGARKNDGEDERLKILILTSESQIVNIRRKRAQWRKVDRD